MTPPPRRPIRGSRAALAAALSLVLTTPATRGAERPSAPQPRDGWKIELLAQAPEITHPSVVTTAPDGRIFVAEDPMDIREDVKPEAPSGRIVCFHPDGRRTVFARDLHAVFGMQYHDRRLYVLHNPRLTAYRDGGDTGCYPTDILRDTLPVPWALGWNDHIPANFKFAMDGYFYLAVGDKGLFGCTGTDGRRLDLKGGGVVRFRPDGTGLEVFATGVRNILDVALNAEDEIFTYDNTDEHQWMGRLTHMVEGGFYGYPHDFIPRRPYTLWMMHDFGAGAACGAVCATEDALPESMRGNLFLSDFGKRQILRVGIERDGATWRVAHSEDLIPNPPDDFRPVGIDWTPDGRSLLICDWQHRDTKANATVGRLWKLSWVGESASAPRPEWSSFTKDFIEALDHPARSVRLAAQSYLEDQISDRSGPPTEAIDAQPPPAPATPAQRRLVDVIADPQRSDRARIHALWALRNVGAGDEVIATVCSLAGASNGAVAAQALRWLGQRSEPAAFDVAVARLAQEPATARLQAAALLGRLASRAKPPASGGPSPVPAILARLAEETDPTVRHALVRALREWGLAAPDSWPQIVDGLGDSRDPVREACQFALRQTWAEPLVPLLRERALTDPVAARLLAALVFQPEPYRGTWWAYHPAKSPPPVNATAWAGTEAALRALEDVLTLATTSECRREAAAALGSAGRTAAADRLRIRLEQDTDESVRAAALAGLAMLKDDATAPAVGRLLAETQAPAALRLAAVRAAPAFGEAMTLPLVALLADGTPEPIRLAALAALTPLKPPTAHEPLTAILKQGSPAEKAAALKVIAALADPEFTPALLAALDDPESATFQQPTWLALAAAPDPRATTTFLDALSLTDPVVTEAARRALAKLGTAALPAVATRLDSLPPGVRSRLRDIFKSQPEAVADPIFARLPVINDAEYETAATSGAGDPWRGQQLFFGAAGTACIACHQVAGIGGTIGPDLTLTGTQFNRAELIDSVLRPARVVRDGYALAVVTTLDGREITGALRGDTGDGITLADLSGQTTLIPRADIADRRTLDTSLMPDGLHAALSPDQFRDLIAYLASRTTDPRTAPAPPLPDGFTALFNGRDFTGWRLTDQNRAHWSVKNGRLLHDGGGGDLWSEASFGDADVLVEWRWPGAPTLVDFPVIDADGNQLERLERVLDAGDSGLFLRGHRMAQANLFCYPIGSGEFWEYRESLQGSARRAVTPSARADSPIGDWNTMLVSLRGSSVTITLNGRTVITQAPLPNLPPNGPIGFQHEHGPLEIRRVAIHPAP